MATPLPPEGLPFDRASYRAVFDASENAIMVLDWDSGAVLEVNRKACESTGYTADEMRGLTADDLGDGTAANGRAQARRYVELAREGRCPRFEWRRRNRDGGLRWDEVHLKPAEIGGRKVLLAFARDITEHKEALEELQRREEQYRVIFEAASDGMFLWDHDLRIVDVNPAGLAIYQSPRDQAVGFAYAPGGPVADDVARQRLDGLQRALAGEAVYNEGLSTRRDGSSFEAEFCFLPVRRGERPQVLTVVRDISDRRRRERELQRSEARLRATVEASFDAVVAMDQEGRIVEFNASAERVFGYRRDEVLGGKLSTLILPERHRSAHERGLAHFQTTGRGPMIGRLVETTALRADGSEFPVELAISVAAVPEGHIFVGHLRDIGARRAAEAERSALEAQLRQAQKMEAIGQLTGGIAHDFNNILTSVIGYVVLAQERAERVQDAVIARQLGQAHLAAQRAQELISQMLAFARRQRGDPRPLALTPLARQTLRLLRSTLPSSIALDAQWLDADDEGAETWVVADPVQLEQILFNLCINARDAMNGRGRIAVRLGRRASGQLTCASCRGAVEGDWVELKVSDSGHGIAPELMDRIFDPFFSTKPPGQGTGMGLAMVHGIVHDHGGHLVVDSRPGEGSAFSVLLPPARPQAAASGEAPARPEPEAGFAGEQVLLVEDDAGVGSYLHEQLSAWGLHVTLMPHPDDALRLLQDPAFEPRLLLTDLTMPGMTGLQLAGHARLLRPGLPVVLVTGNANAIAPEDLRAAGVQHLLRKPLHARELSALLHELLPGRTAPAHPRERGAA
ncbi:PAS domain-containing hybrid sensor histidine kinase/response regulator [Caenimonas aquaedulcis]|uniref:histidine kinase n=1 Tax=Caenimonas aquaedulcis TaxID=2793270 RepID=A0A931H8U8_9BURK|nr:PAS domain S-box protein [Caenimonas aquaedulcis]MBG9390522.1 PAS domain S-box protein [Caenimonas aquaedulcis]